MRVFPDPVGPRKSRFPTGRPGEFNPAQKNLEHVDEGLHALFLTDDLGTQGGVKITSVIAADGWIQLMADGSFHLINPSTRLAPQNA